MNGLICKIEFRQARRGFLPVPLALGLCYCMVAASGCRTFFPPLPPVNLQERGWAVRQGQAVWRRAHGAREITGDVLVATCEDGETFVQFSKTPFPLITARADANRWQVELPSQNKYYAGKGRPPSRLIWLYLPRVLAGEPPPKNWSWRQDRNQWHLENGATGESVEGYFAQ